jgi:hypothetical protein
MPRRPGLSFDGFKKMVTKEEALVALHRLARGTREEKEKVRQIIAAVKNEWVEGRMTNQSTPGATALYWQEDGQHTNDSGQNVHHRTGDFAYYGVLGWSKAPGNNFAGDFFSRKRGLSACSPDKKGSALYQAIHLLDEGSPVKADLDTPYSAAGSGVGGGGAGAVVPAPSAPPATAGMYGVAMTGLGHGGDGSAAHSTTEKMLYNDTVASAL